MHYRAEITESHNPEPETESPACRTKKSDVEVVASTSEDVCPWELGPEPRSRKNSIQLDSGSSSSDISVAVTDVSDRFRRQCGLIQQYTLDGDRTRSGQSGRKLSTASCMIETRRASVSAPLALLKDGEKKPTAVSACETSAEVTETSASETNKSEEAPQKTLRKTPSLVKTCSVTGASAPIISVSTVADDQNVQEVTVCEEDDVEVKDNKDDNDEDEETADTTVIETTSEETAEPCCSTLITPPASNKPQQLQLAPLAVPDCESPVSECAPEDVTASQEQLEAKANDVCPWEDE